MPACVPRAPKRIRHTSPNRLTIGHFRACHALGSHSFLAGTTGTNHKTAPNPLSPLNKSVPVGRGDKLSLSGDSGDKSGKKSLECASKRTCRGFTGACGVCCAAQHNAQLLTVRGVIDLVRGLHRCRFAARRELSPPPPRAARQLRLTGLEQRSQAGCGSNG